MESGTNLSEYLQKPLACVQRAKLRPVEEGGVIMLPGWKDFANVGGSPQSAISHQEGNPVHTADTKWSADIHHGFNYKWVNTWFKSVVFVVWGGPPLGGARALQGRRGTRRKNEKEQPKNNIYLGWLAYVREMDQFVTHTMRDAQQNRESTTMVVQKRSVSAHLLHLPLPVWVRMFCIDHE